MKKIIFYDGNGEEKLMFNNFSFSNHENFPYLFDYDAITDFDSFFMRQNIVANEGDFYSLTGNLEKLLKNKISKFYFFASLDDFFQIIFEIINEEMINVSVLMRLSNPKYSGKLEINYDMKKSQIPELTEQINSIFSDINNPIQL